MNDEEGLATHISALAAPIYAALLARGLPTGASPAAWHEHIRTEAIARAHELWVATLAT